MSRKDETEHQKRLEILNKAGITQKTCSKCKITKPVEEFGWNTSGSDKYDCNGLPRQRPECKTCNRLISQSKKIPKGLERPPIGTPCEICKRNDKKLVYDHNHITSMHRGWLCDPCNRSIGILGENLENILVVANYLNKDEKRELIIVDSQIKIKE